MDEKQRYEGGFFSLTNVHRKQERSSFNADLVARVRPFYGSDENAKVPHGQRGNQDEIIGTTVFLSGIKDPFFAAELPEEVERRWRLARCGRLGCTPTAWVELTHEISRSS